MRESGWYRVGLSWCDGVMLLEWSNELGYWFSPGYYDEPHADNEQIECLDGKMVMTPSGEIVYNNQEHNPVYNTKQEG